MDVPIGMGPVHLISVQIYTVNHISFVVNAKLCDTLSIFLKSHEHLIAGADPGITKWGMGWWPIIEARSVKWVPLNTFSETRVNLNHDPILQETCVNNTPVLPLISHYSILAENGGVHLHWICTWLGLCCLDFYPCYLSVCSLLTLSSTY